MSFPPSAFPDPLADAGVKVAPVPGGAVVVLGAAQPGRLAELGGAGEALRAALVRGLHDGRRRPEFEGILRLMNPH